MLPVIMLFRAYGEGAQAGWGGNHGVNRVVRTHGQPGNDDTMGYVAVGGQFSISFTMPTNAAGNYTEASNPHDNKPTAYLGGGGVYEPQILNPNLPTGFDTSGAVEMDAGIQFETGVWNGAPAGWTALISNDRAANMAIARNRTWNGSLYVNPSVWNTSTTPPRPTPWRGGTWSGGIGSLNNCTAEFEITSTGEARLLLSAFNRGNNTFFWNQNPAFATASATNQIAPWDGEQIVEPARRDESNVKRVIGMTRRAPATSELDGSQIICTFSGGWVRRFNETGQPAWQANDVLQDGDRATGYDAPGNELANGNFNDLAWDRRWNERFVPDVSRSIVEYPNIRVVVSGATLAGPEANWVARGDTAASRNATEMAGVTAVSRYTQETIHINLSAAARLVGDPIQIPTP